MTLWRSFDGQCRSVTRTDVYVTTQLGYARVS
ncbi:MAG: recombinase family protein, partial [Alphaproteobacteria bacterium]